MYKLIPVCSQLFRTIHDIRLFLPFILSIIDFKGRYSVLFSAKMATPTPNAVVVTASTDRKFYNSSSTGKFGSNFLQLFYIYPKTIFLKLIRGGGGASA